MIRTNEEYEVAFQQYEERLAALSTPAQRVRVADGFPDFYTAEALPLPIDFEEVGGLVFEIENGFAHRFDRATGAWVAGGPARSRVFHMDLDDRELREFDREHLTSAAVGITVTGPAELAAIVGALRRPSV